MTLLELLNKAAGVATKLEAVLDAAATGLPDLAPEVAMLKSELDKAIDPANLAALGAAIPGELLNIAQGKLEPTKHAGDAT